MYKRVALGLTAFGLFAVIALGIVSATPPETPSATPQSEASDSFEFLIAVLRNAEENGALTDEMGNALADWFIENRIAPETEETPDEVAQRLAVGDSFVFLIAVLRDADENGVISDRESGLLSDMFIENLVAPITGETPEEAELRLLNELRSESVSVELPAGWSGFLRHPKGAIMDIVERSTSETTTMEITEVRMSAPPDAKLAGEAFYFTVGDIALDRPATLYIPYQLKEDQDATNVVAALWVDETAKWEIVGGIVNEDTRTVEVTTTRLGIYRTLLVTPEQAPNSVSGVDARTVETATSKMSITAPPLAALGERRSSSALVNDVGSTNSGQESSYYDLARKYAPVLRMHPDEQFRPRGVEGFIAQASLKKDNGPFIKTIIPRGEIDDLDQLAIGGYGDRYFLDVPDNIQDPPDSDYPPKVYFTIRENIDGAEGRLFLQYYLFYYNESGPFHLKPHEADWELIQLEFIADSADEIIDKGLAPVGAAYSQHWWAEDRTWDRVEKESGHPVAFVALGKHANYFSPTSGIDEVSNLGSMLLPGSSYELQFIDDETPWVAYGGRYGGAFDPLSFRYGIQGPDHEKRWDTPHEWSNLSEENPFNGEPPPDNGEPPPDLEPTPLPPPTSIISPPEDEPPDERIDVQIAVPVSGRITVEVGEEVEISVRVINNGNNAGTFFIDAHSKRYFSRRSYSTSPIGIQKRLELDPGESETLKFDFMSDTPGRFGLIVNARESALTPDIISQIDYDNIISVVEEVNRSDLDLRLSASENVDAGQSLTYDIRVANRGPDKAFGVRVEMSFAGEAVFSENSRTGDINLCEVANSITCYFGTVDDGETERGTVAVNVPLSASGLVVNSARVYLGKNGWVDPNSANDRASATTRVNSTAAVSPDRAALVALYYATDGPNWSNSTNWLSDRPLGEWHGVSTNDEGHVIWLNLSGNQLSGQIPSELGSLTNLRSLDLGNNQLAGQIPAELGNLSTLTWLDLWTNQLTGPIPSSLGNLTSLTVLALQGNQLTGPIPSSLGNLTNLTWLALDANQLTGSVPSSLGNLTNLTELYLGRNQLSGSIPQSLTSITTLEDFHFGYNDGLCAPMDAAFMAWLQAIPEWSGDTCGETSTSPPSGDPPIADAGQDHYYNVQPGDLFTLDGSGSSLDATYNWNLRVTTHLGSCDSRCPSQADIYAALEDLHDKVVLSDTSSLTPTFTVPSGGILTAFALEFELTVTRGGISAEDCTHIIVNAGPDAGTFTCQYLYD